MPSLLPVTHRDMERYDILQRFIRQELTVQQAATQLHRSIRQVERLRIKVEQNGLPGLVHKNRGKPSNRAMNPALRHDIERLVRSRYHDFGPTFAAEKLAEAHHVVVSKEKLRQLMTGWGLWRPHPRKQPGQYHAWRERKGSFGELVQFDGSYHAWFENRAPAACLLAAIDDATGRVVRLTFEDWEGVLPSFRFWRGYVEERGKPCAIYLDRHSTYQVNTKLLLDDPQALTQFERAMCDLDVEVIHARSPQAKGRVERLFETLQDRLVKELRLRGVSTQADANRFLAEEFLPSFNAKFAVVPRTAGDLHRPLAEGEQNRLDRIFAVRETRVVTNDFTVRYQGTWLQLAPEQPTLVCRGDRVEVDEWMNGSLHLFLREWELRFVALPERPPKVAVGQVTALTRERPRWVPPRDHPWRRPFVTHQQKVETA